MQTRIPCAHDIKKKKEMQEMPDQELAFVLQIYGSIHIIKYLNNTLQQITQNLGNTLKNRRYQIHEG